MKKLPKEAYYPKSIYRDLTAESPGVRQMGEKLAQMRYDRDRAFRDWNEARADRDSSRQRAESARKALALFQKVARETQQALEYHVANVVNLALGSVFDDAYEFRVRFVERRNKTEVDLLFARGGEEFDPVSSSGGGPLDVASFALRCAFWSLKKNRAVLILDEPMKFLSRDLQPKASLMLEELSKRLGMQFIITSHVPELIERADRVFVVSNEGWVSSVREE